MKYTIASKDERNKVSICVRGYHEKTDRFWQVIDTYSNGLGFVQNPLDLPCSKENDFTLLLDSKNDTNLGKLISTNFEYSGTFTDREKELVEWSWEKLRPENTSVLTMMYADKGWRISVPKMLIPGPFHIEQQIS
jgi:hypothetical protein